MMLTETFQLLPVLYKGNRTNLQYLYHRKSDLRINIYPLIQYSFVPKTNELQFYGRLFSWWIAFETDNYKSQPMALIKKGLRFYAECKLFPQMEILTELPVTVSAIR